ncbi:MAG: ABC transporter substrate-binding protein, partial [Deltaproteobacteria bacterium]|nr:ABC transporter substrate-binding protein [Deltaproteobacteria bacterium]MBW2138738.1 ABC transporter substrate-binding protein [Deltaproteobacteria bacterium]
MYQKRLGKSLRFLLLVICVTVLISGGLSQAWAKTFKIGAICALTGPAAAFGIEVCEGKTAWVNAKNAAGGLNGMQVELVKYDTETNTVTA